MGLWGGSQFSTLPLKGYSSANHAYKAAQHWLQTSLYELEGVLRRFFLAKVLICCHFRDAV